MARRRAQVAVLDGPEVVDWSQGLALDLSLTRGDNGLMAKVTGKFQITLPKTVVEQCGIRVGDELELRPVGQSIRIDRRSPPDAGRLRRERLTQFDRATKRQQTRQAAAPLRPARSRGWTREDLYTRGRSR